MKRSDPTTAKEMDTDIDVTSMADDGILNPFKVSLGSDKDVEKEAYLSKLTENKLTQALEEQMFEEGTEHDQNDSFDSSDGQYGTRQSRKPRNPSLWQRPEIRRIVEDFINKDITSRGAANKISDLLGRNVSHSTVLTYANKLLRGIKREDDDDPAYQVQVEPDSPTPVGAGCFDVRFELVKTSRGNDNGLAVYEDNGFVRVYRRTSTTGRSSSYRCSTCDHLYEKLGQGERPTIKLRDNSIVTDPFPTHNQLCTPTTEDMFRRTQEDLEARQLNMCRRILTNSRFKEMRYVRPFDTNSAPAPIRSPSEEEEAINKCIESLMMRSLSTGAVDLQDEDKEVVLRDLIEGYKRGEVPSLTELAKLIKENTEIDVSGPTLCRYLKKPAQNQSMEPEDSPAVLIARPGLSKYLNETLITVPEGEGFRQYSFMKRSSDGIRSYYRCLGCSRAKRLYGPDRQAYVKVEYGEIIDRPLHHRRCEPQSEESVLVQNLDRECRRSIRKGEKNPREAHDEGLGRMLEIEATFSGEENIQGTLHKLFPSWERVKAAYFRQRDLLKKAAIAAELEEEAYRAGVDASDIGRYEEVDGNDNFAAPPGATVELTPEMNALKNQLLFEVQQSIKREVTRAVNRAATVLQQRFEDKIVQTFDEIFRGPSEVVEDVESGLVDEYAVQEFPPASTSAAPTYSTPKRRRFESSAAVNEKINNAPFSIPECYLKRNRVDDKEDLKKKDTV